MDWFLVGIVVFCGGGTALSASLLVYFLRHARHPLARAMTFMLFGEFLTMVACTAYSVLAKLVDMGVMQTMPSILLSSWVRVVLVSACVASSVHLAAVVVRIMKQDLEGVDE